MLLDGRSLENAGCQSWGWWNREMGGPWWLCTLVSNWFGLGGEPTIQRMTEWKTSLWYRIGWMKLSLFHAQRRTSQGSLSSSDCYHVASVLDQFLCESETDAWCGAEDEDSFVGERHLDWSWDCEQNLKDCTEADNPCTAKTPVCTLHLTLRILHIVLCTACRRHSVDLELTKYLHLTKMITYRNRTAACETSFNINFLTELQKSCGKSRRAWTIITESRITNNHNSWSKSKLIERKTATPSLDY